MAWVAVPATQQGTRRRHWKGLFTPLRMGVTGDWTVLVLADYGLLVRWLYRPSRRAKEHRTCLMLAHRWPEVGVPVRGGRAAID